MIFEHYSIQRNSNGDYELIDAHTNRIVTSNASYKFIDEARSRLMGYTSWTIPEAEAVYGINRLCGRATFNRSKP
jgi:hypothetical protein